VSWLDKAIAFLSPKTAYRREAWRQAWDAVRNYDAAKTDRLNNWRASNDSADRTDAPYRERIRARARDLERNSDIAGGIISAFERNIVGPGFQLQAKTEDEDVNNRIEAEWKEWSKARNCDVTGQHNITELLRTAVRRKKIDGGVLIVKVYTNQGTIPFQLQALEVDELDEIALMPRNKGNRVKGGIEYNAYNQPVGYFIRQYNIDGFTMSDSVYVDAKDVIFYWAKDRPSQIREMSDMAPTVTRVRDINQYMEAVSVKERIAACLAVLIKKQAPGSSMGRSSIASEASDGYTPKTITPGMIADLQPGDDVSVVMPPSSGASAEGFLRLQQRLASAGQGLSYETTSRDLSQVNYSSARQGLIEDEMTYAMEREVLLEKVLDEIYETFLISLVLAGRVTIPNFWEEKRAWFKHIWVAPARRWIDPQKEANANRIALETGQKTFQQIAAENGYDWKEQLDDIADALKYANELGIDLGGVLFGKSEPTAVIDDDPNAGA